MLSQASSLVQLIRRCVLTIIDINPSHPSALAGNRQPAYKVLTWGYKKMQLAVKVEAWFQLFEG